ncbi:hypothetical protein LJC03_03265 [Methanobrevibacter sp. OttesenSCG-928-I08]|nr:hypothetical protein [Methanobrevibacter sp. OttesenSCG-928-I08]
MNYEKQIKEYRKEIEKDKLDIETNFAQIEEILKASDKMDYENLLNVLSSYNALDLKYEQLCDNYIMFLKIFNQEESIRLYKTEEIVKLLEIKMQELEN